MSEESFFDKTKTPLTLPQIVELCTWRRPIRSLCAKCITRRHGKNRVDEYVDYMAAMIFRCGGNVNANTQRICFNHCVDDIESTDVSEISSSDSDSAISLELQSLIPSDAALASDAPSFAPIAQPLPGCCWPVFVPRLSYDDEAEPLIEKNEAKDVAKDVAKGEKKEKKREQARLKRRNRSREREWNDNGGITPPRSEHVRTSTFYAFFMFPNMILYHCSDGPCGWRAISLHSNYTIHLRQPTQERLKVDIELAEDKDELISYTQTIYKRMQYWMQTWKFYVGNHKALECKLKNLNKISEKR